MRAKNHQPIDREHHRQIGTDHDTHIAHFVRHEKGNPLIRELVLHRKDNFHIAHFVWHEKGNSHIHDFVWPIGTVYDSHIAQFVWHEKGNTHIAHFVRQIGTDHDIHIAHFVRHEKGEGGRENEFHNIEMQRNSKTINKTETLTHIGPFFHPLTLPLAFHRAWGMSTIGI